jgi:DNA polymerase-1
VTRTRRTSRSPSTSPATPSAQEYAEYKAGRSATPSEFSGQLPLLREVLDALKIRWIEVPGFEADDIIATLTTQATERGMEVVICSGDRDAFQLVSDRVTLLYPVRGVSEVWRMDPVKVTEKYGVPPERYSDLAALVGETSDNLPGIPGVGPKTAAKWITQYGGLTGIVAHIDQIGGKVGDALRAHLDQVLRNRRLNQLVRDLDTGVGLDELQRTMWDREKVHEVFDALEFRVLRERLFTTFDTAAVEADGGFEIESTVLSGADVPAWFEGPGRAGPWGCMSSGRGPGALVTWAPWRSRRLRDRWPMSM